MKPSSFGKIVADYRLKTVFDISVSLYKQGYNDVTMVVGSDRIKEFEMLLNKYNGVKARHGYYKFEEIQIVSAGERDPDADDLSGMSASKLRALAEVGDFKAFAQGVPSKNKKDIESLYKARKNWYGYQRRTLYHGISEKTLITEGVYDQGIFKAVFLSGGPGSGKSAVVNSTITQSY